MVDYHTISPEPLAAMPVPAEMFHFRIQYLIVNYFENNTCQLLRQTWADNAEDFYIQFTYINIRYSGSLIATPARGNIAASLIYLLEGNIAVREQDSGKPLPRMEGDFYMRRFETRNRSFLLDFWQPGTYQIVYISISEKKLASLQQAEPLFRNRELLRAREIRHAGPWIKSTIKEMQDRREPSKDALDRYLIRRTQRLFDSFIHLYDSSHIRWRELKPEERMDQLKVYILNNLGGNLRLAVLAEMLHMSGDALRKMFQDKSGVPLSSFIQVARIKKACHLLEHFPDRTIESIAEEVGYNSFQGFYKTFERIIGCTPRQYK